MGLLQRLTRRQSNDALDADSSPSPPPPPSAASLVASPRGHVNELEALRPLIVNRINLLPWREARRHQQQRDFMTLLAGMALLAVLGVVAAHVQIGSWIEHQQSRNTLLRTEIEGLKITAQKIKQMDKIKARLLGRLESIQNLQQSRPGIVLAFDELARMVPEDIYLNSLKGESNRITLTGIARSNNVVSNFMRRLADSASFSEPTLKVIESKDINGIKTNLFELTVTRKQAKPDAGADNP